MGCQWIVSRSLGNNVCMRALLFMDHFRQLTKNYNFSLLSSLYLCTLINDDDSNNSSSSKAIKHTHPFRFPALTYFYFSSLSLPIIRRISLDGNAAIAFEEWKKNYPLRAACSQRLSITKISEWQCTHKTCSEGRTFNIKNPVKLDYNFTLFLFTHSLARCFCERNPLHI